MKTKKLLAMLIACAMMFSLSMTAFASDPYDDASDSSDNKGTLVNVEHIIDMELPTDAAFDFVLDPLGLMSIEDDGTALLGDLEGGKIVPLGDAALVMNFSSLPVVLTVEFGLECDDDELTFVTAIDDVEEDDKEAFNALIYIVPSKAAITDATIDLEEDFAPAAEGYVIEDDAELVFLFPAAPYTVERDGLDFVLELVDDDTGFGTALQIGGWVNTQADWTKYESDVDLDIVFTVSEVEDEVLDDDGPYAFVSSDMTLVEIVEADDKTAPAGFFNATTLASIDAISITSGVLTFIPFNPDGGTVSTLSGWTEGVGTTYTVYGSGLNLTRIDEDLLGLNIGGGAASVRNLRITMNDGKTYDIKVTLTLP